MNLSLRLKFRNYFLLFAAFYPGQAADAQSVSSAQPDLVAGLQSIPSQAQPAASGYSKEAAAGVTPAYRAPFPEEVIIDPMDFHSVPLGMAVRIVAARLGHSVVIESGIGIPVTGNYGQVDLRMALAAIASQGGLEVRELPGAEYRLVTRVHQAAAKRRDAVRSSPVAVAASKAVQPVTIRLNTPPPVSSLLTSSAATDALLARRELLLARAKLLQVP